MWRVDWKEKKEEQDEMEEKEDHKGNEGEKNLGSLSQSLEHSNRVDTCLVTRAS